MTTDMDNKKTVIFLTISHICQVIFGPPLKKHKKSYGFITVEVVVVDMVPKKPSTISEGSSSTNKLPLMAAGEVPCRVPREVV